MAALLLPATDMHVSHACAHTQTPHHPFPTRAHPLESQPRADSHIRFFLLRFLAHMAVIQGPLLTFQE